MGERRFVVQRRHLRMSRSLCFYNTITFLKAEDVKTAYRYVKIGMPRNIGSTNYFKSEIPYPPIVGVFEQKSGRFAA